MALKIPVSFREDEKDLYDHVVKQRYISIYIKNLILKDMQEKQTEEPKEKKTNKKDLLDF